MAYNGDTTPLSPWAYFWLDILYAIPIVGFVFLLIHAIGANNVNKRNFARSYFCVLVIILIIFGVVAIFGGGAAITNIFKNLFN